VIDATEQAICVATLRPTPRTRGRISAGRRAVIWSTYHVVSIPAIMGTPGAITIVPWIFMQAIVSRERAHVPRSGVP
jgi:hypothetical protein